MAMLVDRLLPHQSATSQTLQLFAQDAFGKIAVNLADLASEFRVPQGPFGESREDDKIPFVPENLSDLPQMLRLHAYTPRPRDSTPPRSNVSRISVAQIHSTEYGEKCQGVYLT